MKNTKFIVILLIMILCVVFSLSACKNTGSDDGKKETLPVGTFLGGEKTIGEVIEQMENAGLSNTDIFKDWLSDFADTAGKNAGLKDNWLPLNELKFDMEKSMSGWENNHDFSDSNCRITAFLLLDELLHSKSMRKNYTGTYLMFDMDAIDNFKKYEIHKKKRDLFITLFGDNEIKDGENPQPVFSEVWKKYGIKINSKDVSLLSVVMYDADFKTVFVGHTGILIDMGNDKLFVEKLSFEQPYQATKIQNVDELLKMFSKRAGYFGAEGEQGPYIYINGDYLGELKKK